MNKLTLEKLYETDFPELYKKILIGENLSEAELTQILSIGLFLVGLENENLQSLGYRLFLLYSKQTNDFKPLYELSLNKGLIPISEFIDSKLKYSEQYGNLYTEINSIESASFKWKNSYQTIGQFELFKKSKLLTLDSQIIVAPTSYGKTELILSFIDHSLFKKICIISPTKSLLAQTKKRIINRFGNRKVVTYPEMYKSTDDELLAVLTQERLLRLLQNNPSLKFDLLVVDEAHNLLDKFSEENLRSVILASVIIICYKRNNNIICKYLTPFLKSGDSLNIKHILKQFEYYSVTESIKSELFYFYDLSNNKKLLLDQYSPLQEKFIDLDINTTQDDSDVVLSNSDKKNIIYLNSPKWIEKFSGELYSKITLEENNILRKAANDIREYVHSEYKLAEYIEKGIIYHHGAIPEAIRYFVEQLYVDIPEVKMLIANSTLLEGINIPATRMFILDFYRGNAYLSPSSFKNLIGRVCRFGEIFDENSGSLTYLLPEIHVVKGQYCRSNANIENFVENRKILVKDFDSVSDEINNPLLTGYNNDVNVEIKVEEILENISSSDPITKEYRNKPRTRIGQLCFENNINIFNILQVEEQISDELSSINVANHLDEVFSMMNNLFFSKIDINRGRYNKLKRLKEDAAQKFYKMLINWRIYGLTMAEMVDEVVDYWSNLNGESSIVYVGNWGDKTRGGYQALWTDISQKNNYEKINLAIVRLKEEFDFIDNEIIKYIEILASLRLIEESLYLKIKYGTDNKEKIALLNCGISSPLSKVLHEKYQDLYEADFDNSIVSFSEEIILKMKNNNENGVLISEVRMNLKE